MKATRKMWIGIVSGVLLTAGGIGYAAHCSAQDTAGQRPMHRMERPGRQHPSQMDPSQMAGYMSKQFGIDEKELLAAINDKKDFRDIGHAAMLAKISGKSFGDVLSMKTDGQKWSDVENSLGVTREQMRAAMNNMMAERIAESGKMDKGVVEKLMTNGYTPRDILCAGKLADASGRDIQSILDKKKINNRWEDVAKELGVDEKLLRPDPRNSFHGRQGFGGPMAGPMMGEPMGPMDGGEPPQPPTDENA